ncbi:DUF2235 domain-containing protein [Bradyrhizobium sp. CB1650]|uniref:DUF2235 domain-containing protein n=1 Tax=Bradyrhizobium sp. CB1650 TaxID=3039153 RepID=UPI002435ADD2|nr:DUF2235 domain-containing protein [Bradyrhizobium sp. CB1650]WGD53873.1 DUF2235 domain-containing protein [Bradyrhizobium sp. CB1650]
MPESNAEGRRIILLLDGTWNDAELDSTDTNISRLKGLIAKTVTAGAVRSPLQRGVVSDPASMVTTSRSEGADNLVYYARGVGTGALANRAVGGALGSGLEDNIRKAYRFLSFHYRPGDRIYIFGFSRGSYTARSLVGYIASAGLLRSHRCDEENERRSWDFYRTPPGERPPGDWHSFTPVVHNRDQLRIECLALFDTVGARGIPLEAFIRSNREYFEFHDVELSSITKVNLHALAIDEHRWPFQATVWRPPLFKNVNTVAEQVWFSGAHADIGGGYLAIDGNRPSSRRADDIALDWMLKRIRHHCEDFPLPSRFIDRPCPQAEYFDFCRSWSRSEIHNSRRGMYLAYPKSWRAIGNSNVPHSGIYEVCTGFDRHATPLNEMIHVSAIERLWSRPDARLPAYAPENLIAVVPKLKSTYQEGSADERLFLVDWSGKVLNPDHGSDRCCANEALNQAIKRAKELS